MKWNTHYLKDAHAILGASNYHWLNYDKDKLYSVYLNLQAAKKGTRIHEWAAETIRLGFKQPRSKKTINMYINDAIGYSMDVEQVLWYSENAFGTADSISFRDGVLRIHDLKTGVSPVSMKQLEIYAALFCLEYHVAPGDIQIELRIYKDNDIICENPGADVIAPIMDKIKQYDKLISKWKEEGGV